ncbi:hypothetical protein HPB51_019039 [Rhipicephalus microplus]|uniref:DDE Tnp4 domain-containing protein n=1 Tax=Rhipicephalus microplus TaxID=6941 RepID=A0A9J6D6P2_RHIMP|nr:hypothetical protein HPB51_019039 [Rhipicephalus microplus]
MVHRPVQLNGIADVQHALCAEDITIWATEANNGNMKENLQASAEAVDRYAERCGLQHAPTKSELVQLRPSPLNTTKQRLYLSSDRISEAKEMQRMRQGDTDYFHKYYRMLPHQFDFILRLLQKDLERKHAVREPISPAERLAMTLRVGISKAHMAVKVTCHALWMRLQLLYMPIPTSETWLHVAQGFGHTWQFLNCIGAVDGKHVQLKCPKNSGSMFFNYKGTYSIALLAVVDCNYKFVMVDVEAYGKQSDGGVLEQSKFGKLLQQGKLQLPKD